MTDTSPLSSAASYLRELFLRHSFTSTSVAEYLGPSAYAALHRGEPAAVRRKTNTDAMGALVRLFLLRDELAEAEIVELVGSRVVRLLDEAGCVERDGGRLRMLIDVRPHVVGNRDVWVFSDADASMTRHTPGPDHVLGVGSASLSLLQSLPCSETQSVLDLGTGSGVAALHQAGWAERVTGTDVNPRALDFARASAAASGLEIELLEGSWFEPVGNRKFERIVANPPFVVGMPEVGHVYRDSGLNLDDATRLVVSESVEHLDVGGSAHIIGAWVHQGDQSWQQRVASWLPEKGVEAWILQRDVANPEHYVSTWLRDEALDPRDPDVQDRTVAWLEHFEQHDVTGVGFGYVALQRLDDTEPSSVTAEEIHQPFDDPLGPEVEEYFHRMQWLRTRDNADIAASRFRIRPTVAREDIAVANSTDLMGFEPTVTRLTRMDGPCFSHEVDPVLADIVAGLHPQGLSLEETVELYAVAQGHDPEALLTAVTMAVVDLVRHGLVLPSELIEEIDE